MPKSLKTIAVVGGTGAQGRGLALRWALAGHRVIIGSRDERRACAAASELASRVSGGRILGMTAIKAAEQAEVVVLTVPYSVQLDSVREIKTGLQGKVLVDVTVPLVPPRVSHVQLPAEHSCVVRVQREVGDSVSVVSAFQNVSALKLARMDERVDCDVLVCSDDSEARNVVILLADDAGMRGIDAGPLRNSVAAEALTSLLIWINRTYKVHDAGVLITGLVSRERPQ